MKGENMSVNNLPETAGTAPEPIPQLALEIRNLAHRAWEDRPNAEFLFREIGKRAQKISERVSALAAPSQGAAPPENRPLPDIRRALAESIEQTLWNRQKPDWRTETWEKRVGLIESAFSAYETAVRA